MHHCGLLYAFGILVLVISGILGRVIEEMAPKIRNSYGVLFEKIHILQIVKINTFQVPRLVKSQMC